MFITDWITASIFSCYLRHRFKKLYRGMKLVFIAHGSTDTTIIRISNMDISLELGTKQLFTVAAETAAGIVVPPSGTIAVGSNNNAVAPTIVEADGQSFTISTVAIGTAVVTVAEGNLIAEPINVTVTEPIATQLVITPGAVSQE